MYAVKNYWSDEADANITHGASIQVIEEDSDQYTGLVDQYNTPIYRCINKVPCGFIK